MPRCLLLLALLSAACFSDNPPQLPVGGTDDSSTGVAGPTGAPTTGGATTGEVTTTGTTGAIEPTTTTDTTTGTTDAPTTGEPTTGEPIVDPCEDATPVCPDGPSGEPKSGLEEIDRCNFPLIAGTEWQTLGHRLDVLARKLPNRPIADVLVNLDATASEVDAVPGVDELAFAMQWDEGDLKKTWWRPRGLSSTYVAHDSGTLAGRQALLVAWRFDQAESQLDFDKGVRVTLVDITDAPAIRYRHLLLVEPVAGDPIDFKPVPIAAGGLAWYGDTLYVADAASLHVFDLSRVLEVSGEYDQVGYDPNDGLYHGGLYPYAAVQIGAYHLSSDCNNPRISTLALDRSVSPPELVAAEYCDDKSLACSGPDHGRIFSWPLDPITGRLPYATTWPSAAAYVNERQVRGVARHEGDVFLAIRPQVDGDTGSLVVLPAGGGPSVLHGWSATPMAVMTSNDLIWGLSEQAGARHVFAVPSANYE